MVVAEEMKKRNFHVWAVLAPDLGTENSPRRYVEVMKVTDHDDEVVAWKSKYEESRALMKEMVRISGDDQLFARAVQSLAES